MGIRVLFFLGFEGTTVRTGDDLLWPEKPTTARVQCGDNYVRCMPYSQGISDVFDLRVGLQRSLTEIVGIVQKVVSPLIEAQSTSPVSSSTVSVNQSHLLRCLEPSPRHCGISCVHPLCRLHEGNTMCSEDLGRPSPIAMPDPSQ